MKVKKSTDNFLLTGIIGGVVVMKMLLLGSIVFGWGGFGESTEASPDPSRWELIESPITGRCYELYNLPGTSEGFLWELVDCQELRR